MTRQSKVAGLLGRVAKGKRRISRLKEAAGDVVQDEWTTSSSDSQLSDATRVQQRAAHKERSRNEQRKVQEAQQSQEELQRQLAKALAATTCGGAGTKGRSITYNTIILATSSG